MEGGEWRVGGGGWGVKVRGWRVEGADLKKRIIELQGQLVACRTPEAQCPTPKGHPAIQKQGEEPMGGWVVFLASFGVVFLDPGQEGGVLLPWWERYAPNS